MILVYLGGWFYMAAIFSGIVGGVRTFEAFIGLGTFCLIIGFLWIAGSKWFS